MDWLVSWLIYVRDLALAQGHEKQLYITIENSEGTLAYSGHFDSAFSKLDFTLLGRNGNFLQGEKDTILVAEHNNQFYLVLIKKHDIEYIPLEKAERMSTCLKRLPYSILLQCKQTEGLRKIDITTGNIELLPKHLTSNSNSIRDASVDKYGYIWVASSKGLSRIHPSFEHAMSLGTAEGIINTGFEWEGIYEIGNDRLFIAGDNSNYIIDVEKAHHYLTQRNQLQSQALFTNFSVSEKGKHNNKQDWIRLSQALNNERPLTIQPDENLFSFDVAVNNYQERNVIQFEYKLSGILDEWRPVEPSSHVITLSTLPDGLYDLAIRAVDRNSAAVQPITKLQLQVLPPWWRTWQVYLLYALVLFSTIYFVYLWRTRVLQKRNLLLERTVTERTQQISGLLEQKQSFFANVSHEFRTPLALILGPLENLLSDLKEPEKKEKVSLITRNAKRLTTLVDQVLELAKIETSKSIPKRAYDLKPSIELITESFRPLAESNRQTLTVSLKDLGLAELLEDTLEKVIGNLLTNAFKYAGEGANISVTIIQNNNLIIVVRDNGPGIAPDLQANIFERFTRATTNENISGSGIGLALVREIVEANNGHVSLLSTPKAFTEFTITLPIKLPETNTPLFVSTTQEVTVEESVPPNVEQLSVPEPSDQASILVIEDNADMRQFLLSSLNEDYTCFAAGNGHAGLQVAIDNMPDLIISDVMMPEMDGFELAAKIREHHLTSHIPLILLTAKGDQESRKAGWLANVDDFIGKPFSLDELKLRVANLLSIRAILNKQSARKIAQQFESNKESTEIVSFTQQADQDFYQDFLSCIEQHYEDESFSRAIAAKTLAVSERQLNRKLTALADAGFVELLRKYRLGKAKQAILLGVQISQVAYQVGFSSPSYFTKCFKAEFGLSPKAFSEQNSHTVA